MVASAPGEASGKIWSRTSPREEGGAAALRSLADGNVPVRTAAVAEAGTGKACGCVAGFFSAAAFSELRGSDAGDGFPPAGTSPRVACSAGFAGAVVAAVVVEADEEESGRWPRIFGRAMTATIIRSTAATGTT